MTSSQARTRGVASPEEVADTPDTPGTPGTQPNDSEAKGDAAAAADDDDDSGGDDDDGGLWVSDDVGAGAAFRSCAAQPTAPRARYSPRLVTGAKTYAQTRRRRASAYQPKGARAATRL